MSATTARVDILERRAFTAWPALESRQHHGWLLRAAGGHTRRANSANALSGAAPVEAVRETAERFFAARRLPTVFRLTPLAGANADGHLAAAGYVREDECLVMTADLAEAAPPPDPAVTVAFAPNAVWREGVAAASGLTAGARVLHDRMLSAIVPPAGFAVLSGRHGPAAYGLAVAEAGHVGLFEIVTVPEARRRGFGRRVVRGLLAWGRSRGATTAYLQVKADNAPAIRLYASLGFREAYRYHYRIAP